MSGVDFSRLSEHEGPEVSPGFLLWRASSLWRRAIEFALKPLDLTHSQFVVLSTVGWLTKDGSKSSQVDIGRFAGLDPNTTSQVLRGLQTKELIDRVRSHDERSKHSIMTLKGAQVLSQALPAVEKVDRDFFRSIRGSDLQFLQQLAGYTPDTRQALLP